MQIEFDPAKDAVNQTKHGVGDSTRTEYASSPEGVVA
jgi:uncharacterized DUF497 family protein